MEIKLLADCPDDAKKISRWYYDEWSHISPDFTEEKVFAKVSEKAINREIIPLSLVAHNDGKLVGVVELKFRENANYPEYEHWLGGLFVQPAKRGAGIASQLIISAKEKAVELGIKCLYLQCESHNVGLYRKHGFKSLHTAQHHNVSITIMKWSVGT